MKLPVRILINPGDNSIFAVPAVALSLFLVAFSAPLGPPAVLAFYTIWLPPILLAPAILLGGWQRVLFISLLPILALLSVFWSDQPQQTLRASIQYGSTIYLGLVAARIVSVPHLVLGGVLGSFLILFYLVVPNASEIVQTTNVFKGPFGSKNTPAFLGSMGFTFAALSLMLFKTGLLWRLLAIVVGGLAVLILTKSQSATAISTTVAILLVILVAKRGASVSFVNRRTFLIAILVMTAAVALVTWWGGGWGHLLELQGKDDTLTGRTDLWLEAQRLAQRNQSTGLGYHAFWSHGRPEAEELWGILNVRARSGFDFHSTMAEAYVDLGLLGFFLVLAMLTALLIIPARLILRSGPVGSAITYLSLALIFATRALVEVEFFKPYTVSSFLVPYIILRAWDQLADQDLGGRRKRSFSGRRAGLHS